MFETRTAKRPGLCVRCHEEFEAGTRIRWMPGHNEHGEPLTYHLKRDCDVQYVDETDDGHTPPDGDLIDQIESRSGEANEAMQEAYDSGLLVGPEDELVGEMLMEMFKGRHFSG